MRAFIGLAIPPELRPGIAAVQEELRTCLPKRAAKWSPAQQWHLTIHFLGETKTESFPVLTRILAEVCRRHPPFALEFTRLGAFPNPDNPRVLWLGIAKTPALDRFQAEASEAIGLFGSYGESRTYHPHITLARPRSPDQPTVDSLRRRLADATTVTGTVWRPSTVHLFQRSRESPGTPYTVAGEFPLGNWGTQVVD